MPRLYLSPPHLGKLEFKHVQEAFRSNWIAPVGPHIEAFEREFCKLTGAPHAAALSSGTAALHLALKLAGLKPGDEVHCSSLTFAASANPIVYEGGRPVFVDSERQSWNMDPDLLAVDLAACARRGKLPRAVVLVHLYGQSADIDPILTACRKHRVALIEDAAESLGATYKGKHPGTLGDFGVFSFNGNKIITTSNGGMLVAKNGDHVSRARFLATQARDPAPHYQHSQIGYNYRLSNILAGIGRGQLTVLEKRVKQRRANFEYYRKHLAMIPGLSFMPEASHGKSNRWLTVCQIDAAAFGATPAEVRLALEKKNIEARPAWKPLHLQPVFRGCRKVGGAVSEEIFERGLCLPSGSAMTKRDLDRVVDVVLSCSK